MSTMRGQWYGPASGNVSISINAVIRVGGPQPQQVHTKHSAIQGLDG